jgi:membrane fusion protein (multidrug efflux system)
MTKKIYIGIFIVVVVVGALAAVKTMQIKEIMAFGKSYAPPPETISSAVAHEEQWQDALTAVGSITAAQGVTVAAEVPGTVVKIDFESGAVVAKGDLLAKLDTSTETAQLQAAEAQVELARLTAERTRKLREDKTVSQSEQDIAESTLKQSLANADNIRATIDKKTIRAPFAGRLGIRLVNLGQQLDVGKGIVSLQALMPVYADFSLPQQNLSQLQTGLPVQVTTDAYPDQKFAGTLTAINPDLDAVTRSVTLRATFENTNQWLRPGMFVRAAVILPQAQPVLAVPATAILSIAGTAEAVYVIEPSTNAADGLVVRQQIVRTGRTHGDFVSVVTGLKAGDRVVSAGLFKLHNGAPVTVNNDLMPKPSKTPNPSEG